MECAEIRPSLSEYLDSALDAQTMRLVEKHVLTCRKCKETLESLRSVVQELGDLHPVKPPEDFIEQLHDRMTKRFSLKELTMRLFVPFRIKIPLQFATAAAMAVLIFFIIHTPEIEKEMADIPKLKAIRERVEETDSMDVSKKLREKEALAPASEISPPGEPHSEKQLAASQKEAVPKPPLKETVKAIELVLLLKSEAPMPDDTLKRAHDMKDFQALEEGKTRGARSSGMGITAPAAKTPTMEGDSLGKDPSIGYLSEDGPETKDEPVLKVLSHDKMLSSVRELIYNVKGTVLSIEYDRNTDRPKSLATEIPAGQYGFFFEKLQQLGTLQTPTPAIDATGLEHIKIRIQFTYP